MKAILEKLLPRRKPVCAEPGGPRKIRRAFNLLRVLDELDRKPDYTPF